MMIVPAFLPSNLQAGLEFVEVHGRYDEEKKSEREKEGDASRCCHDHREGKVVNARGEKIVSTLRLFL